MTTILAHTALLPTGWAENVFVQIDPDGRIGDVQSLKASAGKISADNTVPILLPAPVNVHSHAFQRAMAGLTERRGPCESEHASPDNFWTWRQIMFRFLDQLTPQHVETITALVQMEMLESGYATNVEFHYLHHQRGGVPYDNPAEMCERIMAAAIQTGIGLTLLPVHYQSGGCDGRSLSPGQIRFGTTIEQFQRLHGIAAQQLVRLPSDSRIGIAPHSLRAVSFKDFLTLANATSDGPFHLHLAEQAAEVDEVVAATGQRPVEWLLDHAPIADTWCLIHCTQMLPHETAALAQTGAVAGLCPITESNLGDGIFDGVRWLHAGGQIAIGSDSNVRISLSEELRTLDYSQRLRDRNRAPFATAEKSSGRVLFEAVLAGGALAAGRKTGRIETGMWADLLALSDSSVKLCGREGDSILDSFIFAGDDSLVRDVWSAGRHLVTDGRHLRRDEITNRYREVIRSLLARF